MTAGSDLMNCRIQSDFDDHWGKNFSAAIPRSKITEAQKFFRPVITLLKSQETKVFEAGCGDGVHWTFIRNLKNDGLSYTGIDISAAAINRLREEKERQKDRFIKMDLSALSEPDNSYDIVFAFGVIAYTQRPEKSFAELCRICKPGGWVGIWVYPEPQGVGKLAFYTIRHMCRLLGPFATRRIADSIVPFMGWLPTRSKVNLFNASWKQCREVILVNIAPRRLSFFQREEVILWFENQHITVEYEDENNQITLWGRKNG
jgi:ubiquinone/menaquinone biosynthesis C-methylase UbiE